MSREDSQHEPTMEEILASIRRIISEDEEEQEGSIGEAVVAREGFNPEEGSEEHPEDEDLEMDSFASDVTSQLEDKVSAPVEDDFAAIEDFDDEVAGAIEDEADVVQDDDVLELTDRVEEEDAGPQPEEDVFETAAFEEDEIVMVEEHAPADEPEADEEEISLVSPVAAVAAAASFGSLAQNIAIANGQGRTLEDLVQEMLKPVLKEWLDTNLPSMVEDLVREEIARIAKRTGRK